MAAPTQAAEFAKRFHAWLVFLDPLAFEGSTDQLQRAADELAALRTIARGLPHVPNEVASSLVVLQTVLPEQVQPERIAWLELRESVAPYYDDLARAVRASGGRARDLHPTNFKRSFVHLLSGLLVVGAFIFVFTERSAQITASAFVVWAWSLEGARRVSPLVNRWCMWFFGPIARDHESYKINSATWYGTALWVLAFTAFGPGGVLGLLALAVGDPLAGIVGRRWGRIRLGGKSLEGCLAFALSSGVAGSIYLFGSGSRDPFEVVGIALFGGAVGAVVELLSTRLEDNFTIPVFTAWVLQIAWFGWP